MASMLRAPSSIAAVANASSAGKGCRRPEADRGSGTVAYASSKLGPSASGGESKVPTPPPAPPQGVGEGRSERPRLIVCPALTPRPPLPPGGRGGDIGSPRLH